MKSLEVVFYASKFLYVYGLCFMFTIFVIYIDIELMYIMKHIWPQSLNCFNDMVQMTQKRPKTNWKQLEG